MTKFTYLIQLPLISQKTIRDALKTKLKEECKYNFNSSYIEIGMNGRICDLEEIFSYNEIICLIEMSYMN